MFKKMLSLVVLLYSGVLFANTPTQELEPILNSFQSLSAQFTQVIKDARGNSVQKSSGEMLLHRPAKFRWNTEKPNQQYIIANGEKLWIYDVDLEQVSVQPFVKTKENSPALLLSGDMALITEQFHISVLSETPDSMVFQLTPKSKDHYFQWVDLHFVTTAHYPEKVLDSMTMKDNLDQLTEIKFSHVIKNPKISAQLFNFVPPKGVDVISAQTND